MGARNVAIAGTGSARNPSMLTASSNMSAAATATTTSASHDESMRLQPVIDESPVPNHGRNRLPIHSPPMMAARNSDLSSAANRDSGLPLAIGPLRDTASVPSRAARQPWCYRVSARCSESASARPTTAKMSASQMPYASPSIANMNTMT